MFHREKSATPLEPCDLKSARFALRPHLTTELLGADLIESIKIHLGGETVLSELGARKFLVDHDCVSFQLSHSNPARVRTVVIAAQPRGMFSMHCYGYCAPSALSGELIGWASDIVPENLATVLGKLTGNEAIHHRHF